MKTEWKLDFVYFNIANTYTFKKKYILLQDELVGEKIIY